MTHKPNLQTIETKLEMEIHTTKIRKEGFSFFALVHALRIISPSIDNILSRKLFLFLTRHRSLTFVHFTAPYFFPLFFSLPFTASDISHSVSCFWHFIFSTNPFPYPPSLSLSWQAECLAIELPWNRVTYKRLANSRRSWPERNIDQLEQKKQEIVRSKALIRNHINSFDVIFENERRNAGGEDVDSDAGEFCPCSTNP